jgi:hypothetical protein
VEEVGYITTCVTTDMRDDSLFFFQTSSFVSSLLFVSFLYSAPQEPGRGIGVSIGVSGVHVRLGLMASLAFTPPSHLYGFVSPPSDFCWLLCNAGYLFFFFFFRHRVVMLLREQRPGQSKWRMLGITRLRVSMPRRFCMYYRAVCGNKTVN